MKSELSIDQKLKCHEVFAIVDSDKSGFADRAGKNKIRDLFHANFVELMFVLKCLGLKHSSDDVEKILREYDDNSSGGVELDEFEHLIFKLVCI